jgi:hypothetical protein
MRYLQARIPISIALQPGQRFDLVLEFRLDEYWAY